LDDESDTSPETGVGLLAWVPTMETVVRGDWSYPLVSLEAVLGCNSAIGSCISRTSYRGINGASRISGVTEILRSLAESDW